MKKRSLRTVLAAALIVSCLSQSTSYGAWIENNSAWQYQEGEETVKGWGLIENEWYFFGPYGDMVTGWQKVADKWYFFNPISNGTKGKMLTGWQWIDGYCYYFTEMKDASHVEGEMWIGEVTPDGYIVDGSGRWTDAQGIVQFLEGKGILTFKQNHAQSRFSSGGSGGGGGTNSHPDNPEPEPEPEPRPDIKPEPDVKPEPEPATPSEAKKLYTYTIRYMDIIDRTMLYMVTGQAEENERIEIDQINIEGYTIHGGQKESFSVSTDGLTVNIYYDPITPASPSEAVKIDWSIYFIEQDNPDNQIFKAQTGKTEEGREIIIDFPETILGTDGYYYYALVSSPYAITVSGTGRQKYYIEYERGDKEEEEDPEHEAAEKLKDWQRIAALADEKITGYIIPEEQYQSLISGDLYASNERIKNMVSMVQDADPHEIYIIGLNHIPNTLIIGQTFPDVINISSLEMGSLDIGGQKYTMLRIGFTRSYDKKTCVHDYELTDYVPCSCTAPGYGSVQCRKCGSTESIILPSSGHTDLNHDGICEVCFKQIEGNDPEPVHYNIGDVQARRIKGKIYLFRCIDEDYGKKALFLCDSTIRSDIDSSAATVKKLTFGSNNNYKYSYIRTWLNDNADDLFGAEATLIGTNVAYQGATGDGSYEQFNENELIALEKPFQLLEDEIFILSVEEAIQYREYLWRFGGSEENNQETQYSAYSRGYYLRTPQYKGEDGFEYGPGIYVVDFSGSIHPVSVSSTDNIGIRPVIAIRQQ
jgi:hypothetical protein